jgi:hypothetical protein
VPKPGETLTGLFNDVINDIWSFMPKKAQKDVRGNQVWIYPSINRNPDNQIDYDLPEGLSVTKNANAVQILKNIQIPEGNFAIKKTNTAANEMGKLIKEQINNLEPYIRAESIDKPEFKVGGRLCNIIESESNRQSSRQRQEERDSSFVIDCSFNESSSFPEFYNKLRDGFISWLPAGWSYADDKISSFTALSNASGNEDIKVQLGNYQQIISLKISIDPTSAKPLIVEKSRETNELGKEIESKAEYFSRAEESVEQQAFKIKFRAAEPRGIRRAMADLSDSHHLDF